MVKVVIFRGAPAVGKTTIANKILKELKIKHKLDCAYICEDDFRKQMQFKYKAKDLKAHLNSFELIKTVMLKLLELDSYEIILLEGQLRYKQIVKLYEKFAKEQEFEVQMLQFNLNLKEMSKRDVELRGIKSPDIKEVKKDIDAFVPKYAKTIQTDKPVEESVKEVISLIL